MEKHITKELADIASEMRLAGAAMTDLMARLDKVADELANEALIADDADEAKDAEEDRRDVEEARDGVGEAKQDLMDAALSLASLVRIYSR